MAERFSASIFHGLYRPSECDLRLYLRSKAVAEDKPSPYEEILIELGKLYEKKHLNTIGDYIDLSDGTESERIERTFAAIKKGAPALYQPLFRIPAEIDGRSYEIVGEPDLLLKEDEGYRIRDVKMSRRITEKDHPEILLQLGLYGWLYEQALKVKPRRLEVFSGAGTVEEVGFDSIDAAYQQLGRIASLLRSGNEPFSPVGWTKCGSCGFRSRCWPPAVKKKDVATVPGVDQGLARALREKGVTSARELMQNFDGNTLAAFERPWGARKQRVGKSADKILRFARAIDSGKEDLIQNPVIRAAENYVMFDLEGLPPQLDDLDKIYLWGMQIFGSRPSKFFGSIAAIGADGDLKGWEEFLANAKLIFDQYGDLPFVHWHHYERTRLGAYVERYGDRQGIAERVKNNLLDLLPVMQASIALPLPSYSLKVVEQYVGFKRTQDEYGGDWAMAAFIRATETDDESKRKELLDAILTYNKEDLAATWAVLEWLKGKATN